MHLAWFWHGQRDDITWCGRGKVAPGLACDPQRALRDMKEMKNGFNSMPTFDNGPLEKSCNSFGKVIGV